MTRHVPAVRRAPGAPAGPRALIAAAVLAAASAMTAAHAAQLNLPKVPLFVAGSKTALVQLVVERDNKLFYEAYPSYADIDGDGEIDIRYDPERIDYYGYFESTFCYRTVNDVLEPVARADVKRCGGVADAWSGDFLNYLTMTRMDIMLRALYGGKRVVDTPARTVLRRAFVPWENHTWGIEYASEAVDGYRIDDYSPLEQPLEGRRHLLATNNIVGKDAVPYLRVREGDQGRIWEWVDTEGVQGEGRSDLDVRLDVRACAPGFPETTCRQYPNGGRKPVGLLHDYGENDAMYFGLVTGSYENNLRGGVVRRNMASFGTEEIDPGTGQFLDVRGIVHTLDALQIPNEYEDKKITTQKDCERITDRAFRNGECRAWGNPVAEMMYEGLRHFSGATDPTPSFYTDGGLDARLGLEAPDWEDPYAPTQPWAQCSAGYQLVVSDPSPSFDGDQLPGSHFAAFTESSLGDLHVGRLADMISSHESALPGTKFIGEADGIADGSPSPKPVTTFRTIRGQAPEAPHRQGSYYAQSVAYHGRTNDLNPNAPGKQSIGNFTLALGSPLPTIDVPVGDRLVSFAPFGKTVGGCGYKGKGTLDDYVPTNAIVGFVVEEITPTSGTYRISFEDVEQGADNDMDALLRFRYEIVDGKVVAETTSFYASGCLEQHLGYTVSGTDADGVYLVVRDVDTEEEKDVDFRLDVPPGARPGTNWEDGEPLPLYSRIEFTPSGTPGAAALKSPLWYAAKWGGFDDRNGDGLPQPREWDADADGEPDNYFPVTDPSRLRDTLASVFQRVGAASGAATAVGVSGGTLGAGSHVYETSFRSEEWTGQLTAHEIARDGKTRRTPAWDANATLARTVEDGAREVLTWKPSLRRGVPFRWPDDPRVPRPDEIDSAQADLLSRNPIDDSLDADGPARVDWLRGEHVDGFRQRAEPLGDIVHSTPQLVGPPVTRYRDDWGRRAPETAKPYSTFGERYANRRRVVYVGANDGMLHAFDAGRGRGADVGGVAGAPASAGTGAELFAYVPDAIYRELPELPAQDYGHEYYVDATPRIGDAFVGGDWRSVLVGGLGRGGQGIYALDVTEPDDIDEASADEAVLWEFGEAQDPDIGYTYSSPLIVRLHNGRWAALFGNGYNNSAPDDRASPTGQASLFVVDLETGLLVAKLGTGAGSTGTPNALAPPTAVDLDNDDVVDLVYAGDLEGNVWKFDLSSSVPSRWSMVRERIFVAEDGEGRAAPITTAVAVGRHPTGTGVLVYIATGKYLEPSDQRVRPARNRVWALWDPDPFAWTDLHAYLDDGELLEQRILREVSRAYDTDGDGTDDTTSTVRESTTEAIDWDEHRGWYLDLTHAGHVGEQVVATPLLRENRLIVSTQIPGGDECTPVQGGWLMLFDAAAGGMPTTGIDLDGDGYFTSDDVVSGVRDVGNPMASPAVVAAVADDVLLTSDEFGGVTRNTTLDARTPVGRIGWRELEP